MFHVERSCLGLTRARVLCALVPRETSRDRSKLARAASLAAPMQGFKGSCFGAGSRSFCHQPRMKIEKNWWKSRLYFLLSILFHMSCG